MNNLSKFFKEAIQSVLPIFAIVLLLSVSAAPMESGVIVMFLFGTIMLIVGMGFFTIGSGISMEPLGEGIGITLGKAKKIAIPLFICLVLGILITIAEPDLTVLAEQVPSIPDRILIWSVAVGVGIFLVISMIRTRKGIKLNTLLLVFYGVAIVLAFFAPNDFIPTAFDSGGVTTGPITVPFIMALGAGMASMSTAKNARENSFGLIALCSIGPILSVLILSIVFKPQSSTSQETFVIAKTTKEAFEAFINGVPKFALEVFSLDRAEIEAVVEGEERLQIGIFDLARGKVVGRTDRKIAAAEDDVVFFAPRFDAFLKIQPCDKRAKPITGAVDTVGSEHFVGFRNLGGVFLHQGRDESVRAVSRVYPRGNGFCRIYGALSGNKIDDRFCVCDAVVVAASLKVINAVAVRF